MKKFKSAKEIVHTLDTLKSEYHRNVKETMTLLCEFAKDYMSQESELGEYYFQEPASEIKDVYIYEGDIIIKFIDRFGDEETDHIDIELFNSWLQDKLSTWDKYKMKMKESKIKQLQENISMGKRYIDKYSKELEEIMKK